MKRDWAGPLLAVGVTLPGIIVRIGGLSDDPRLDAALFGVAIVGAAFLLAWATEVAELDISGTLAVAILAFIAVLPEYAVDLYFAWTAAADPHIAPYATANMTGANRLLIGVGWSMVVILMWLRRGGKVLSIPKENRVELAFLVVATLFAFSIPFRSSLTLVDAAALIALFVGYMWIGSKGERHEVELMGPAAVIAGLGKKKRRLAVLVMMVFSAIVIVLSADRFAHGLVQTGLKFHIDEFVLVQWVAPLASEAPELLIAGMYALHKRAEVAMTVLISSKVNQWTLLVGSLPLAYYVHGIFLGNPGNLPLDSRQQEEILLTAAQSLFALVLLVNLRFNLWEALALFLLFATQLAIPNEAVRRYYAYGYIGLAALIVLLHRSTFRGTLRLVPETIAEVKGRLRGAPAHEANGEET